jgi:hypothetical protein
MAMPSPLVGTCRAMAPWRHRAGPGAPPRHGGPERSERGCKLVRFFLYRFFVSKQGLRHAMAAIGHRPWAMTTHPAKPGATERGRHQVWEEAGHATLPTTGRHPAHATLGREGGLVPRQAARFLGRYGPPPRHGRGMVMVGCRRGWKPRVGQAKGLLCVFEGLGLASLHEVGLQHEAQDAVIALRHLPTYIPRHKHLNPPPLPPPWPRGHARAERAGRPWRTRESVLKVSDARLGGTDQDRPRLARADPRLGRLAGLARADQD